MVSRKLTNKTDRVKRNTYFYKKSPMRGLAIAFLLLILISCKDKVVDLSGNEPINQKDFLAVFPALNLPYLVSDTNIDKTADTLRIGLKAFQQFFPDSAFESIMGKSKKFVLHPVGIIDKKKEKYLLFIITEGKKKKRLVVFVTDQKNKFLASKELLNNFNNTGYSHSLSINKEPTFLLSKEKTGKDNNLLYSRAGWVYNDAGIFMVVINDSNEDPLSTIVINPLDTLPTYNKFSGDYFKDKKNTLSVRDGKDANNYRFFIHFEKNNGSCVGELKGEFKLNSPTSAIFTKNGDPCIIDFSFNRNSITLKEQGSCGNHRGIKCFFDDSYTKKKPVKIKKNK